MAPTQPLQLDRGPGMARGTTKKEGGAGRKGASHGARAPEAAASTSHTTGPSPSPSLPAHLHHAQARVELLAGHPGAGRVDAGAIDVARLLHHLGVQHGQHHLRPTWGSGWCVAGVPRGERGGCEVGLHACCARLRVGSTTCIKRARADYVWPACRGPGGGEVGCMRDARASAWAAPPGQEATPGRRGVLQAWQRARPEKGAWTRARCAVGRLAASGHAADQPTWPPP